MCFKVAILSDELNLVVQQLMNKLIESADGVERRDESTLFKIDLEMNIPLKKPSVTLDLETGCPCEGVAIRPCVEYCRHIWAGAAKYHLSAMDSMERRAKRLTGDTDLFETNLQSLEHWRRVASLSVLYRCAQELFELIPPSLHLHRTTLCTGIYPFGVNVPPARTTRFASSFIMRTANDWNNLPASVLPASDYVGIFKSGLLSLASAVDMRFPSNFLFGAATSAYQVEGGWNVSDFRRPGKNLNRYTDNNTVRIKYNGTQRSPKEENLIHCPFFISVLQTGKGESLWDHWVHSHPETILDRSTGDVAADSYNKWEQDVDACVKLGLQFYRFSISWTRILPTGFTNQINEDGVKYYKNLINMLRVNNIEPMVTLYHWDLPIKLQELGGWTNPLIVGWFASYAEVVFSLFADQVNYWITINEPSVICELSYSTALAPSINERILAPYICNKNILLAHAKAWRIYDKKYKSTFHGRVSVSNHLVWFEPANEDMKEKTELAQEFLTGRYCHPIYSKKGGWPPKIEKFMAELSKKQGFDSSRLPSFTYKEKKLIRGTYDFFGMNHYTTRIVRMRRADEEPGVWFISGSPELDIIIEFDPKWEKGGSNMFAVYPPGIRKQLAWLKDNYGDLDYIVTENGFSNSDSRVNDERRINFIYKYLEQILLSIKVDNVNVIGYTYWSLIDNFEWMDGFSTKFGLYEIDFNDPDLLRIPRDSAKYYASVIKSRTLIDPTRNSTQKHTSGRYKRKEPLIQNGGQSFTHHGGLVLNALALILCTIVCI